MFTAGALFIGALTFAHSFIIMIAAFRYQNQLSDSFVRLLWAMFILSGLQQLCTLIIYFWSFKMISADAEANDLKIN